MTTETPEWRALKFNGKVFGIYRLPGASQWRYLKKGGERLTFDTTAGAITAARERALSILFPKITSSMQPKEKDAAESLGVEQWLRQRRDDQKAATTVIRGHGKKSFQVVKGRVVA